MSAKFLFLASTLLAFCTAAQAQNNSCPPYIEPEIIQTHHFKEPGFDHSSSLKEIAALQHQFELSNNKVKPSNPHWVITGMTTPFVHLSAEDTIRVASSAKTGACIQISQVKLDVSATTVGVFIAKEFPEGSCSYNTVLEHELRHVALHRKFLDVALSVATPHIREYLQNQGVTHTSVERKDEVAARINKAFGNYVSSLNSDLFLILSKWQQEQIDTPEEYARMSTVCDGELARIVRNSEH